MPNLGSLLHPHVIEDALVVHRPGPGYLGEPGDLIIGYAMANIPYMPNLGSLLHPDGLEEALLVHQPGPGHLGEVW